MYGGDGQDAVNIALTPVGLFQQQAKVTLDDLTSMAGLEYALLKYAGNDPIACLHARSIASQIAAYIAVGEMDSFCGGSALLNNNEAAIRRCKEAFRPVIATALNRHNCISGIPGYLNCDKRWKYYGDVLSNTPDEELKAKSQTERAELLTKRAQNVTLGRILLGGCAGVSCSQYNAVNRWIDPSRRDHLGLDIGNDYDKAVRPIQYRIARELAWSIFSGDSTFGSGIIGKRTGFKKFSNETGKKEFCADKNCLPSPVDPLTVFYGSPSIVVRNTYNFCKSGYQVTPTGTIVCKD